MIEEDLSRVEECATKYTYRLGVDFKRCENKGEKSAPKFIPSSTYHKEQAIIKSIKAHYPSNLKPSLNPRREARKETPKPRVEAFVCMFYGYAGHLNEFCFRRKRLERKRFEYARNSNHDEFFDFQPRSCSHASPHTSSCAFSQFSYEPNHRSYGFGLRENRFEPRHFGYDTHPHRGDYFLRRPGFPAGGFNTHFEPRHLDVSRFPHRGSHPTRSNGDVQKIVKTYSGLMVSAGFLRFISLTPALNHRPFLILCR
jgi:hypothetical protein